jgi:hypothetical protein
MAQTNFVMIKINLDEVSNVIVSYFAIAIAIIVNVVTEIFSQESHLTMSS